LHLSTLLNTWLSLVEVEVVEAQEAVLLVVAAVVVLVVIGHLLLASHRVVVHRLNLYCP
jgi:hypothetical protein